MKQFLKILLTFFLFLVILEVALSITFYFKDKQLQAINLSSTRDAPYLYYTFSPSETDRLSKNIDGFKTNTEVEKKDSSIYRIVLIGGSVAEALGCEENAKGELAFQKILNEVVGTTHIEVIDAGTSAYGIEQEFLLTQLILQKYKPNLIIGLHGYNDLISFKFNRYINDQILLPPQNYRDFLVIEEGKKKNQFVYRFTSLFKSTVRAFDFFKRYVENKNAYDYSSVTEKTYETYSNAYVGIIQDIKDFNQSKGIKYYDFLQPIRYYNNKAENYLLDNSEAPEVAKMYHAFEEKQQKLSYATSLTAVFDTQVDVYTDECHLTKEGNIQLATKMATILKEYIQSDSAFIKLKEIDVSFPTKTTE